MPDNANDLSTAGAYTRRAVEIFNHVEARVVEHERRFGYTRLLATIENIQPEHFESHTSFYREIIRGNTWPNIMLQHDSLSRFLDGFERSALAYVDVGFQAMRYLCEPKVDQLPLIHQQVLASEALRGQFGKSSPDGLDAHLERHEKELLPLLANESQLVLLGTPADNLQTAESALLDDFVSLASLFPTPHALLKISDASQSTKVTAWRFLRRHARWSVSQAARFYEQLDDFRTSARLAEFERKRRSELRSAAMAELPPEVCAEIDAVVALNFLNLTLEPSFSFKGCVGIPHGLVFREAATHGLSNSPVTATVSRDKWKLFNSTPSEVIQMAHKSKRLPGKPAALGCASGRPVVVRSEHDLDAVLEGDVLVAVQTDIAYVPAMHRASAIVTETGGRFSHAAVWARDYKKPTLLQVPNATQVLSTVDYVTVNADAGYLEWTGANDAESQ